VIPAAEELTAQAEAELIEIADFIAKDNRISGSRTSYSKLVYFAFSSHFEPLAFSITG